MPAPTSTFEFTDLIRKSGLIQPDRLDEFLRRFPGSDDDPSKLALGLIQEGLLTNFQARQLLRGRYRGFAIGKYLLLEQLGEGGMGKVFLCEHMLMRRRVAIKVLSRELANEPGTIERFQREARAVASLDHPNIVRAHDVDCEGENHFIVMEYVDGASLHEIIRKRGPLPIDRACNYIKQAAIGLQAVADAGMIHRDIKPGNLLLDRKGQIKVLDLGLARFEMDKRDAITQRFDEGSVLGTADYLSPEQAMNSHEVDIRADIYSLGATFYFMLTGRPPFEGGTVTQKLLAHQLKEPEPIKKLRPDLPDELVAVIERMMAKEATKRFQTPQELVNALAPWTQQPVPAPDTDEMPRLCLAAQRAGTAEAGPLPNLPPTGSGASASSFSRSNLSNAETPRSMSNTSLGNNRGQPATRPPLDPRLSGSQVEKSSSSVVLMSGMHSGIASSSRVGLGESSTRMGRSGTSSSTLRGRSSRISKRRRNRWPIYAGLAGLLIALLFGGFWFFSGGTPKGEQLLIVSRTKQGANVFSSITEAWNKRDPERPGRILVQEKVIEENVRLIGQQGVTNPLWVIEGNASPDKAPANPDTDTAQTVTWKTTSSTNDRPLLQIENVSNLNLQAIRFEAGPRTQDAVVVAGNCSRFQTRGVSIHQVNRSGLQLLGASGNPAPANIRVSNITFYPGANAESGVLIANDNQFREPNRHIGLYNLTFQQDTAKNAAFKAGIQVSSLTEDLQIEGNKFLSCETGVSFKKLDQSFQPFNVHISRGEFRNNQVGLRFETLDRNDRNALLTDRLRFFSVARIAAVDDFVEPVVAAKWIWYPEPGNPAQEAPAGKRYFRHKFRIAQAAQRAFLDIACDDQCVAYLNGKRLPSVEANMIAAGRAASLVLAQEMRSGENVLAIEAENLPAGQNGTSAGLIAQISFEGVGRGQPIAMSDGTWLTTNSVGEGWMSPEYNDRSWKKVRVLGDYGQSDLPWRNLAWDGEIRNRFGRIYSPVAKMEQNHRDSRSFEGFPNLDSRQLAIEQLEAMVAPRTAGTSAGSSIGRNTPGVTIPGFLITGPFAGGFDDLLPPETDPSPEHTYFGQDGKTLRWERIDLRNQTAQHVDFGARFGKVPMTAYVLVWIISEQEQNVELYVHADDCLRVWHDGNMAYERNSKRALVDEADKILLNLKQGRNKFLFKVTNLEGESGFMLKLKSPKPVKYSTSATGPAT